MKIKFSEIIRSTRKTCGKSITMIYTMPCELDKSIVKFLGKFGKPKFDLDTIKFLHIEDSDGFMIKGRLEKTSVNFSVAKESKNAWLFNAKKVEFEDSMVKWIEDRLEISIIR